MSVPVDSDHFEVPWGEVRRVAALGEPLLELQPAFGEVRLAFGGDVANSMVCLARILGETGPQIAVVTALGGSGYSEWLRECLHREGVQITEPRIAGEPGIYGLPLDPARWPGFSYWRASSAARQFLGSVNLDQLEELLGASDLLVVTGITLALCSDESFRHLCQWIERHRDGCRIVFDANFRVRLWENRQIARQRIGALELFADVIATGAEDEQALWGCADAKAVMRRLEGRQAECLIRGGADGCWVRSEQRWKHVPAQPIRPVDSTGAGDAHLAGYVAARIAGRPCSEAASYANEVAALVVGQHGSVPRATVAFAPLPEGSGALRDLCSDDENFER